MKDPQAGWSRRLPWLPLLLLALVLAFGAYARLVGLGELDFHEDELDLVYGARSLAEGNPPLLPSGMEYGRGLDFMRIVQGFLRLPGDPETIARIPATLFGILAIGLIAVFGWIVGGPWTAVVAATLLAIYPDAIVESRRVRFYSYQLALVISAMIAGWYALRPLQAGVSHARADIVRRWLLVVVALGFFGLAARAQVTSFSVIAGWGAFAVIAAGLDLRTHGRKSLRSSVPLHLTVIGVVATLLVLMLLPELVQEFWRRARSVPNWAGGVPGDVRTYYWMLSDTYPAILALTGVVAVVGLARFPALAAYCLCWFAVPLFLHSFVFAWKGARFVQGAMPGLFLLVGMLVPLAGARLRQVATELLPHGVRGTPLGRFLTAGVVGTVSLFAIASTPAFNEARKGPPSPHEYGWSFASTLVDSLAATPGLIVGAVTPFEAYHYLARVDFTPSANYLESAIPGRLGTTGAPTRLDWYVGLPILHSPELIRSAFPDARAAAVLVGTLTGEDGNIDPGLQQVLTEDAEEICAGRCRNLRLYLWEFGGP